VKYIWISTSFFASWKSLNQFLFMSKSMIITFFKQLICKCFIPKPKFLHTKFVVFVYIDYFQIDILALLIWLFAKQTIGKLQVNNFFSVSTFIWNICFELPIYCFKFSKSFKYVLHCEKRYCARCIYSVL